jgi:hypothetical protein
MRWASVGSLFAESNGRWSVFGRVMDRVDKDVVLPLQWTLVYSDALEAQVRDPH